MNIYPKTYYKPSDRKEAPTSVIPKEYENLLSKSIPKRIQNSTSVNKGTITPPNIIHRVLTKMGFGAKESDVAHIQSLAGATDEDKVLNYINEQLNPNSIVDTELESMLNNGFSTLNKTRTQLYQQHLRLPGGGDIPWEIHILPGRETVYATFLKGIHSKKQLFETLTDFWHNHFNVFLDNDGIPAMFGNYDRNVIRANALGNFRQMLYDVTQSTCMLAYLGNGVNELSAPNENYARELLELHTLSADNYYAHLAWDQVPIDGQGRRVGYVEEDVLELARALTGWSYNGADWWDYQNGNVATGEFQYRDDWHDKDVKRVLGTNFSYDSNNPMKDVNDILDMLAEHPATADFLARKLCIRYISDTPNQATIDLVSESLHQNWQHPEQIKLAMEVLLTSSDFLNTWGEKIKRPFERTVSAMRLIEYSFPFDPTDEVSGWHYWGFINSGQSLFYWTSPNGYPDQKKDWLGSSSTMATWRYIQWVSRFRNDALNQPYNSILDQTLAAFPNANDRTANNIVNFWFEKACGVLPDTQTQDKLAQFMSLASVAEDIYIGRDDPIDLHLEDDWPDYNRERLYAVVSTIFLTTEFSYR